ncbi:MAG: cadmium-translocating P-type ATPase [Clostridiales bacterium]|nr:cadmium-translocating P-type ATPase [Clostridiales bacterium]
MNQRLILKDLNCPHCAGVIEEKVRGLSYVNTAEFNMVTKIIDIDTSENNSSLFEDVKKIVKQTEPEVTVLSEEEKAEESGEEEDGITRLLVIRLIAGLCLTAGAVLIQSFNFKIGLYITAYIVFGYDVVIKALKNIAKGEVFDENFLMSTATIGAFFIGEYPEAAAVMLFYQIGELFQDLAVGRASRSVKSLLNIMPENANVVTHHGINEVPSKTVRKGSVILVKAGDKVPLDGIVLEGESYIDKKALTGESLPELVKVGERVLSGSINGSTPLKVRVEKTYSDSTAQKILRLTEEAAGKKSKAEKFITKFAKIYTPMVVFLAVLIAVIPTVITGFSEFNTWLYRAIIFLAASCPCALVVSIPLGFFAGNGKASAAGVLIKGSAYIQSLAEADTAVFDKTGTLTEGVFKIANVKGIDSTRWELLNICGSVEKYSSHPIAKAICSEAKEAYNIEISEYEEISGMGIKAKTADREYLAGNAALMDKFGVNYTADSDSKTTIYTASNRKLIGTVTVADAIKKDSEKTISALKNMGIKTVLLTGDKKESADEFNKKLKLDEIKSELLPADKLKEVEALYKKGSKTIIYVGDGINDAPILRRADVGAAMGGLGSDSAIEAADCVIMSDEPSKILSAISISRETMRRIKQNTTFVITVKVIVLAVSAVGLGNMWLAVFADIGTALIAILNSIR